MSSVYKNQDYLTIYLDTNTALTGATSLKILYKKPDGTQGEWTGEISNIASNSSYSDSGIKYAVESGDIDQAGEWGFQSYFVLNGEIGYGEVVYQKFNANLD